VPVQHRRFAAFGLLPSIHETVASLIVIVVPEIRATERTPQGVRLTLWIPAELSYFQGHFRGCPILPGVVQVAWAIELARQHLPFKGQVRALNAVKFNRVIVPQTILTLHLEHDAENRQLDFTYAIEGRACSNGTIVFDDSSIPDVLDSDVQMP
jgi:3-hydroxymyristoyl/3-hydroxydecanoyl-(acyl carrier protein) dehydratase